MPDSKEMYIRFKDGNKEVELNLVDFQPENQLAVLDGVFKFFEIDIAFKEIAEISLHTRKAYLDFYNGTTTTEWTETNEEPIIEAPIVEETITPKPESIKQAEVPANWTVEATVKEEEYWFTGIKKKAGINHYRLHYKCPSCLGVGNIYIKKEDRSCYCRDCRTQMMVRPASTEELGKDSYGNFFIAGNYNPVISS